MYTNITHAKLGDLRLVLTSLDSRSYTLKGYGSENRTVIRIDLIAPDGSLHPLKAVVVRF